MHTLGDILEAAISAQNQPTLIEVVLHSPGTPIQSYHPYNGSGNVIQNIKALRSATMMDGRDCMGLTAAKAAIEEIRDYGFVTLRMTPERYGYFMVNRHDLKDYTWQVKSSRFIKPERPMPPVREPLTLTI